MPHLAALATALVTLAVSAGPAMARPVYAGTPPSAHAASRKGATVSVRKTRFGRILTDGRGFALYLFTSDTGPRSTCAGACAKAWPPLLTNGVPRAARSARTGLLGATRRGDGRTQVTYRGHPLYFYVGDREPRQVLCQDVFEFGGRWLVVSPSGRAIR
jgi:predicted lipoprotein with Yx(FWY)xxD motif